METTTTPPVSKFKPKRSAAQRAADLAEIATMTLCGRTQCEIAAELSAIRPYTLGRTTITADLGQLKRQWAEAAESDVSEMFALTLAKLAHLERSYWSQFEEKKESRWLDGVLKIISQRIALLGLNRPTVQNLELSGYDGQPMAILVVPERQKLDRDA